MEIVLIILGALLLLVLCGLAIPVEIIISVHHRNANVMVAWLFGLIRYTPKVESSKPAPQEKSDTPVPSPESASASSTSLPRSSTATIRPTSKKDKPASDPDTESPSSTSNTGTPPPQKRSRRLLDIIEILRTPGFMTRILKLGVDLFKRVRIRILSIRGRIGLGNPAETGQLLGLLYALTGMLMMAQQVVLEPDFEQAIFEIDGQGAFRLVPLQIILVILMFLLSPPTLRVAWAGGRAALQARRAKKRANKD